jgi:glycosyltransferase involved in cell wall biosynthesis
MAEAEFIPRFDAIYVCSQLDRIALSRRFPNVKWEVIPNIVPSPPVQSRPVHTGFTFLFVGTLDYAPNKDAVVFFSEEVLPLLRKATSVPFRVRIVGRNPDETVIGLANGNDVEVIANPADVAPYYSEADVCIAPIRGGGGTRIKILEAFSHKLPVVSTTIGSEGLNTVSSVDIEIADSADDFAIACARLLKDSEQRARLAAAGYEVYQSRFSSTMLARLFRGIHANQHANIALISS